MKPTQVLMLAGALWLGLGAASSVRAQGLIAEATNERTQTFSPGGTPGPIIDSNLLRGRPAQPEGPFGLIGVDTSVGHVLVRRSAVMFAGGQPRAPICDDLKNLAPNTRNYGSNGFGSGCPARTR